MIITCPNCSARYKVKDGLIQEKGKKVKCKKCEAVFVAYPGNRSVIKEPGVSQPAAAQPAAAQAAPAKPAPVKPVQAVKPPAPPVPVESAPQATVKVDRSQLTNYLNKSRKEAEVDGQTVQIDRSQVNALIQQSQEPVQPPTDATVQVDRSQIEAFLQKSREQDEQEDDAFDGAHAGGDTVRLEPGQFPNFSQPEVNDAATIRMSAIDLPTNIQEPASDEPTFDEDLDSTNPTLQEEDRRESIPDFDFDRDEPNFGNIEEDPSFDDEPFGDLETPSFDEPTIDKPSFDEPNFDEPSFDEPSFDEPAFGAADEPAAKEPEPDFGFPPPEDTSSKDPEFPSDEELGLASNNFDSVSTDAFQRPDFGGDTSETSQSVSEDAPPAPPQIDAFAPEAPSSYNARVDGVDYPNLSLESIERWIQEGRLLESDQIDSGGGHYRRADDFPEIAPFFKKFYQTHGELPQQPPAKKGFFGKLFSIFKK